MELVYNSPLAGFSYELLDSGEILFDSGASTVQQRYVKEFIWSIEGEQEEYSTSFQQVRFDFEQVNQKNVTLKVVDDEGATDQITQFVDYSSSLQNPTAKIEVIRSKGRASREAILDAGESLAPGGEDLDYSWSINGNVIPDNLQTLDYVFPDAGEYEIQLVVTNAAGKKDETTETIEVEELRFDRYLQNRYRPGEALAIQLENYIPDNAPELSLNGHEIEFIQLEDQTWSIPFPFFEPEESVEMVLSIDNFTFTRSLSVTPYSLSENPIEDSRAIVDETILELENLVAEYPGIEEYVSEATANLNFVVDEVESYEDEDVAKYFHYMLDLYSATPDELGKFSFKQKEESRSLFSHLMNAVMPTAHAVSSEQELYDKADTCNRSLSLSENLKRSLDVSSFSIDLFAAVNGLAAVLTGGLSVPISLGAVLAIAAIEIGARIAATVQFKNAVKYCLTEARFPFSDSDHKMRLSFTDSLIDYENNVPVLKSGISYSADLLIPIADYFYESPSVKGSALYTTITSGMNLYNNIISELTSSENIFLKLSDLATTYMSSPVHITVAGATVNGVSSTITALVQVGADIQAQKARDEIGSLSNSSGNNVSMIAVDTGSVDMNNLLIKSSKYNSGYLSVSSSGRKETTSNYTLIKVFTAGFGRLKQEEPSDVVKIEPSCNGERVKVHPVGGGSVSTSARVGSKVRVAKDASVCGNSIVTNDAHIADRSIVDNSSLVGCDIGFYGDSFVTNGTIVRNGGGGRDVQLSDARLYGASFCGASTGGQVSLAGTFASRGATFETTEEAENDVNILPTQVANYNVSGDVTIKNSILLGSGFISDSRNFGAASLERVNVGGEMNFNMIGGDLYRSFIDGQDKSSGKRYTLRIVGGVNIDNTFITLSDSKKVSTIERTSFQEVNIDNFNVNVPFLNLVGPAEISNTLYDIDEKTGLEKEESLGQLRGVTLTDSDIDNSSLYENVTLREATIDGSHLSSNVEVHGNSGVDISELGPNVKVIGSDIDSSKLDGNNEVQGSSVSGSELSNGVDILDSEIYNVKIDQDKDDNYCSEDNVNLPPYDENMNPNDCYIARESGPNP